MPGFRRLRHLLICSAAWIAAPGIAAPLPPASRIDIPVALDQGASITIEVAWPENRTPWTVLRRLAEGNGYGATGDTYPDAGQHAGEILTAFLATRRENASIRLHHLAAD